MSNQHRIELDPNTDWNREPTAEELANAPELSQAEMLAVMKSQEYRNSKLVQKLVAASLAKGQGARLQGEEPMQTGDEIAAKQASLAALFRDPRYRTDAAYRYEVSQKIKALTANDNAAISNDDIGKPNQSLSVGLSTSPYHGADLRVRKFARVQIEPTMTGPTAPVKPVAKQSPAKQTPEEFVG
ncbi:MAG TPA: hypothetical protein VN039_05725 [Nitrospira sp.]|nr:hypothetical protein [Nitrospira sp.]